MRKPRPLSTDLFLRGVPVQENQEEDEERARLLRALRRAMEGELTDRQQTCVRMRYFENRKVIEIADELRMNPATVSRHLSKARSRLCRVLGYSFPRYANGADWDRAGSPPEHGENR